MATSRSSAASRRSLRRRSWVRLSLAKDLNTLGTKIAHQVANARAWYQFPPRKSGLA
jgi:hypothetical protein